jgi:glucose-6-phosphate isomerase
MQEMFSNDPARASKFNLKWNDFLIDYSKNIICQKLSTELANEMGLKLLFKIILMAALSIKQRIELYCILH